MTDGKESALSIRSWLQSGKHLPPPLRDFHDQKEVFKSIWEAHLRQRTGDSGAKTYLAGMTWVQAHIFVIDHFLWFMAAHGWTLQRSRAKALAYADLDGTISERRAREAAVFRGETPHE